ncbi:MAG: hypothetical protein KGY80_07255 [Candidatus Thorarchaeota archaeon]|nr:hypothetical protein [Candidatus Thorarchaeota archaeon]
MAEIPIADKEVSVGGQERPLGITILAILQMLGGLFSLIAGAGMIALGAFSMYLAILGGILLLFGLISFYVGYGLWNMESWAWKVAIIVNIISIVLNLIPPINWVGLIIPVIIVIYLQQEDIKKRFK